MHLLPKYASRAQDTSALVNRIHHAEFFELCGAMPDASVDMVLCDLPYAVLDATWDTIIPIDRMWAEFRRITKPRGAIVLTATEPFATDLRNGARDIYKYDWVYINKARPTMFIHAKNRPLNVYELCLVFSQGSINHESVSSNRMNYFPQMEEGKPYKKYNPAGKSKELIGERPSHKDIITINQGTRYPTNIIELTEGNHESLHPSQKPTALFEYLIRTYTQPGQLVFDPTVGSGTTAVAARNTGRQFVCGDFTHEYVEIARRRVAGLPGKQPEPGVPRTIHMFAEYDPEASA